MKPRRPVSFTFGTAASDGVSASDLGRPRLGLGEGATTPPTAPSGPETLSVEEILAARDAAADEALRDHRPRYVERLSFVFFTAVWVALGLFLLGLLASLAVRLVELGWGLWR